jgi:acyl-[acyl-carrier-protein] desaturase
MKLPNTRLEVMKFLGLKIDELLKDYLKPIDQNWQPSDLLPDSIFTKKSK